MVEKPMHLDGNAAPRFAWMGRVAQPSFGPPLHDHDIWELVYYTSGSGIVRVGETEHPISQGTLLCLPPHVPHVQVCTEGYTNYFLGISGDLGATLDGSQVPTIYEGADGSLLPLLAAMHRESCQREVGWQAVVDALFASLLIILRRRCATKIFPAVERLKHMLCDRMQDPNLRIGQTLTKAGLSRDHLRRRFLAETGRTPARWLTELRIEHARVLLGTGAYGVAQVAELTGFSDPFHFSRVFRRLIGKPPSRCLPLATQK